MNKRIKKKQIRMKNRKLCERYPFLRPRNRFDDTIMWKHSKSDWRYVHPYAYTELDDMPDGWRKAFGEQICEEIKEELLKFNYLDKYRIAQIKEKYGELRWYDFGIPANSKAWDIIDKYSELSTHTCICCGRPAEIINNYGWYAPICVPCRIRNEKERKEAYEKWKRKSRR